MAHAFVSGDLVFAKVKGYPAWPARITRQINSTKFRVFFYGTFEHADIKKAELWPFNQENKDKFGPPNIKRKGYAEGLHQIENEPDLADVEDSNLVAGEVTDAILADSKPPKVSEGSPVGGTKGVKRTLAESDGEQSKSPAGPKSAKQGPEQVAPETGVTPNTVSRSVRQQVLLSSHMTLD